MMRFSIRNLISARVLLILSVLVIWLVFIISWLWSGEFYPSAPSGPPAEAWRKLDGFITASLAKLDQLPDIQHKINASDASCSARISSRMAESDRIWRTFKRKRLDALRNRGANFLTKPWDVHSLTILWDFFIPAYPCPVGVQERIGRAGDGGKWVCGFSELRKKNQCIVYSYGVSREVSFEAEILERSECHVHMFDHTINMENGPAPELVRQYPDRATLYKYGLGANDTEKLRTLQTQMKENGHQFIDILKMDVEGAEFDAFRTILSDFPGVLPFGQLQIELHLSGREKLHVFLDFLIWFDSLESAGFGPFFSEPNLIPMLWAYWSKSSLGFSEYAFLNTKLGPDYWCNNNW